MPNRTPKGGTRCAAKNRRGERCGARATPGRRVCRLHGGLSLSGPAHPRWKHGRYAKYLPDRNLAAYLDAVKATDLASLRAPLALVEAREVELLGQLTRSESGALWARMNTLRLDREAAAQEAARARAASRARSEAGDEAGARTYTAQAERAQQRAGDALREILDCVAQGGRDQEVWTELRDTIETRRRLVETERRRIESERAYLTPDQMMSFVGSLLTVLRVEVKDRRVLQGVLTGIKGLLGEVQGHHAGDVVDAEVVSDEDDAAAD